MELFEPLLDIFMLEGYRSFKQEQFILIYFGEGVGEYLHEINFSEDYKIWSSILIFVAEETSLKKVAPPTSGDGHTEYRCRLRLDPKGNPGEGFK